MKIILLQDIKGLGKKGEIKNASDGYVLNFLLPKKLVSKATSQKIEILEKRIDKKEKAVGDLNEEQKSLINKLKGVKLEISGKVSDGGKLFAGLSEKNIVTELKQQKNIEVDEKNIKLVKHLKDLGEHKVVIDFGGGLSTKIVVNIVADISTD